MDGFYDQQVPFVVSESVSVKDFMQIFRKEKVKCDWAVCLFFFFFSLFLLQKWHSEDAQKCLSERKRKFMDTELAQDTEG